MKPLNETARLRVVGFDTLIPQGEMLYRDTFECWLCRIDNEDWQPVGIALDQGNQHLSSFCSGRALDVEDGLLLVNGKRIQAEAYLGLWRDCKTMSAQDFAGLGYSLQATVSRPSEAFRKAVQDRYPGDNESARRHALLDYPSMHDTGTLMCWTLDLLTMRGMSAWHTIRSIWIDERDHPNCDLTIQYTVSRLPHATTHQEQGQTGTDKELDGAATEVPSGPIQVDFFL